MNSPADDGEGHARNGARMGQIAEALGVSEAALREAIAAGPAVDTPSELLRLWIQIEDASDRRKLFAFARSLAARK